MAHNDVAATGALWFSSHMILNITMWAGGLASDRHGEPAGRVITSTATAYAAFRASVFGFLTIGRVTRATMCYLLAEFARWFSWESVTPVSNPKPPKAQPPRPPNAGDVDTGAVSDSRGRNRQRRLRAGIGPAIFPNPLRAVTR